MDSGTQIIKGQGWEYDPVTRICTAGGKILPGSTDILADAGFQYPKGNMDLGKAVHLATEYLDKGILNPRTVTDNVYGYLMGWQKFKKDSEFSPDRIEEMNVNMALGYKATLDREGPCGLYGKRTLVSAYRITGRGGKGVITIKTTVKNGRVIGAFQVTNDTQIMMITTHGGKVIRMNASEISIFGRGTQGVRLIGLAPDERVAAVAKVVERE